MKLQSIVKDIIKNKNLFIIHESTQQSELKPIVENIVKQYIKNIDEAKREPKSPKYSSYQNATSTIKSYISPAVQHLLDGPLHESNLSKEQIKGLELWLAEYTSLIIYEVTGATFNSHDIQP